MAVALRRPAPAPARSRAAERLPATALVRPYVILALFALTAVGWRALAGGGAGVVRYFHPPMVAVVIVATGRLALLKRIEPLVIAFGVYTAVYMAFAAYNGLPPYAFQQAVYAGAAFMAAASLRQATERDWRILRWTGPVAVLLFLVVFFADAKAAGVDVIGTYKLALTTGNLNLIQFNVFQQVFNAHVSSTLEANSAALRGQIIAGVLVSVYLSVYAAQRCRGAVGRLFPWVSRATIVVTALLVVLAFARYLQVVVAIAALVAVARLLIRGRANLTAAAAVLFGLLALTVALATPIASTVYERFTADTGSYDERGSAVKSAIDSILRHPFTGTNTGGDEHALLTGDRTTLSAHNFVLDAAVSGGVLMGLLAAVVAGRVVLDVARGIRRFVADPAFFPPMAASLLAPVVMFSAGSGTLAMPELLGLALFYVAYTDDVATPRAGPGGSQLSPGGARRAGLPPPPHPSTAGRISTTPPR